MSLLSEKQKIANIITTRTHWLLHVTTSWNFPQIGVCLSKMGISWNSRVASKTYHLSYLNIVRQHSTITCLSRFDAHLRANLKATQNKVLVANHDPSSREYHYWCHETSLSELMFLCSLCLNASVEFWFQQQRKKRQKNETHQHHCFWKKITHQVIYLVSQCVCIRGSQQFLVPKINFM